MTPLFDFSPDVAAFLALAVVAAMFVMFLWERWTTEVVAIGGGHDQFKPAILAQHLIKPPHHQRVLVDHCNGDRLLPRGC